MRTGAAQARAPPCWGAARSTQKTCSAASASMTKAASVPKSARAACMAPRSWTKSDRCGSGRSSASRSRAARALMPCAISERAVSMVSRASRTDSQAGRALLSGRNRAAVVCPARKAAPSSWKNDEIAGPLALTFWPPSRQRRVAVSTKSAGSFDSLVSSSR